jgi:hypothetical protein
VEGELCPPDMTLFLSALVMAVVMVLKCDQGIHVELPKAKMKEIYEMLYVNVKKFTKRQSIQRQSDRMIILKRVLRMSVSMSAKFISN